MGVVTQQPPAAGIRQLEWSALCLPPRPVREMLLSQDLAAMRREVRQRVPREPGIYGFLDLTGELIYVGYSGQLDKRLVTYFGQADASVRGRDRGRKEHRVASRASVLVWEETGHAFAAMHRELELIQQFQPRLNVRGRSRRQRLAYLVLTQEEAPRFALRHQVSPGARGWWGPLWIDRSLTNSVEALNRCFRLPDCPTNTPMAFAGDPWLLPAVQPTPCLRGETGSCLAPCAAGCSRSTYFTQLQTARDLLNGKDDTALVSLEQRIVEAATTQRFEVAARLRDLYQPLVTLQQRLDAVRNPTFHHGVYPIRMRGRRVWLLISGSVVQGSVAEPLSRKRVHDFIELIDQHRTGELRESTQRNRLAAQIVDQWFRRHPEELTRVQSLDDARRWFHSA